MGADANGFEDMLMHLRGMAKARQSKLSQSIWAVGEACKDTVENQEQNGRQGHVKTLSLLCKRLLLEVQAFRRWLAWGGSVLDQLPALTPLHKESVMASGEWISMADIDLWLVGPVSRLNMLVKAFGQAGGQKFLPREVGFWVDELKFGVQLAGIRIAGQPLPNLTALRLQYAGCADDVTVCVKNTFLHACSRTEAPRSWSISVSMRLGGPLEATPEGSPQKSEPGTPTPDARAPEATAENADSPMAESPANGLRDITNVCRRLSVQRTPRRKRSEYGAAAKTAGGPDLMDFTPPKTCAPPMVEEEVPLGQVVKNNKATSQSPGWWKTSANICPISGFPISLLPYPPFKLCQTSVAGVTTTLVDGGFLVVNIIATLNFEVLGQKLGGLDVEALDDYMQRCRLGRGFRLGEALRLMTQGDKLARMELDDMRDKARRKLTSLKNIQRNRLRSQTGI